MEILSEIFVSVVAGRFDAARYADGQLRLQLAFEFYIVRGPQDERERKDSLARNVLSGDISCILDRVPLLLIG